MTNISSNQDYLVNQQYKDAANLNARIQLHERFGTDKYDWQRWVFDHLQMSLDFVFGHPGYQPDTIYCILYTLWTSFYDS